MCTGRVDLEFILRALANGHDGVLIGGCRLNECNYVTQGNYDALAVSYLAKKIMSFIGLNPDRLAIRFMNASDGILLAQTINEFDHKIRKIGPLGEAEGIDKESLDFRLAAARKLVPYLRLVERERLRMPIKSLAAYQEFYNGAEAERLFEELVVDKLVITEIMQLLSEGPLSTGELAKKLALKPSDISRYMNTSSMHGLVRYDVEQKRFMAA